MKAVSLKKLVRRLSSLGLESLGSLYQQDRPSRSQNIGNLCDALLQLKGEAASIALAQEIIDIYLQSSQPEKLEFLQYLDASLRPLPAAIEQAIRDYQTAPSSEHIRALHEASESPRLDLFRALNMAPQGIQALIRMRTDILDALPRSPSLKTIDQDLLGLFRSWFNRGFLNIRRIDWKTPAAVLEKLIEYESVHEIQGWPDLRRRLREDRRCFGFFHPVMPLEPLIFVEVALTSEISVNISDLLEQEAAGSKAGGAHSTAVFYSINNCLRGLRGVSFGNLLIKQVMDKLEREMPSLATYATLSPVPKLTAWLQGRLDELSFLQANEKEKLGAFLEQPEAESLAAEDLQRPLLAACAHYLIKEKRRGKPPCPVARFHLGNGAILDQLNWRADMTENGLRQSGGIMVNYRYDKGTLARNHQRYEQLDAVICSANVRRLLPE